MAKKAPKRPKRPRIDKARIGNPHHQPVADPRPPAQRGQGRKPMEFDAAERRLVENASGIGLQHRVICRLILRDGVPIDVNTLEKHFSDELNGGKAKAHFNVGKSLYDQAVGVPKMEVKTVNGKEVMVQDGWISEPDKIAAIWFSKAQMGWRDGVKLEITDIEAIVAGLGGNLDGLRAFRAALAASED